MIDESASFSPVIASLAIRSDGIVPLVIFDAARSGISVAARVAPLET